MLRKYFLHYRTPLLINAFYANYITVCLNKYRSAAVSECKVIQGRDCDPISKSIKDQILHKRQADRTVGHGFKCFTTLENEGRRVWMNIIQYIPN